MSHHGLFSLHPSFRDASGEDSPPRSRVKRALFGPTDHDENLKFVKRELEASNKTAINRWNFNFKEGTPCEGRYQWEKQKQQEERREPPEEHKENPLSNTENDVQLVRKEGSSADIYTPIQGTSSAYLHTPLQVTSAVGRSGEGGSAVDLHTLVQETSSSENLHTPVQGTSSEAAGRSDEAPAKPRSKGQKLVSDFLLARKSRTKRGKMKVQEGWVAKRNVSPVYSSSD